MKLGKMERKILLLLATPVHTRSDTINNSIGELAFEITNESLDADREHRYDALDYKQATLSMKVSVYRAVRSLERKGLVEIYHHWNGEGTGHHEDKCCKLSDVGAKLVDELKSYLTNGKRIRWNKYEAHNVSLPPILRVNKQNVDISPSLKDTAEVTQA